MHTELSWTPRRTPRTLPGGIYCSPACGFNCTRAEFDYATKQAAALAKRMGPGWEPHVWENWAHWHYTVNKGPFELWPPRRTNDRYSAKASFGDGTQFSAEGDTPENALGFLTQDVRSFVRRIEAELAAAFD